MYTFFICRTAPKRIMWKVVRIPAGNTINIPCNFVVAYATTQFFPMMQSADTFIYLLSLYQSTSLSVSLCVWMFPNSSETANPSELKFLGMIPLGMEKVLG